MRRYILAAVAAAAVLPAAAQAQSYGEVRHDRQEMRHDRRDLAEAKAYGDRRDVRDARADLRGDRQETREDWHDYRRAHPEAYRGAAYAGPRGWAYRPVAVGYRFAPAYYSQRYWIDPAPYRLRPIDAWQRWVRYGNDVLLVNVRTGRVLEVNRGFFY